jgi:hypothetical protein
MAPTLNDKTANTTADQIEQHLKHGDGLASVRDEVEKVRKEQGGNFDKKEFTAWMQKVGDKLHADGILPRLDIVLDHDKVALTGISGDGKFDGKGDLITQSGKDGRFGFGYDKKGDLTSLTDSKGAVDYKFKDGQWTNSKDGTKAEIAVDAGGNVHVMHENGTETDFRRTGEEIQRNAEGQITSQKRGNGSERDYVYDSKGQVQDYTEKNKDGAVVTQATRNADGTFTSKSAGPDGILGNADDVTSKIKNIEIDGKENLKITNTDGTSVEQRGFGAKLFLDQNERLTDLQTTNGKQYHYDYNGDSKQPDGLTISTKGADGMWGTAASPGDDKVEQTFKLENGMITATGADGKTETYKGSIGIDDRGRAIVTDEATKVETTYGLSGAIKTKTNDQVTQVTNPDGTENNFKYDGNKLQQATLFAGTDHQQTYELQNGKWMVKDANGDFKPADATPSVDDNGNIRLTKANGDKQFTEYTPMGEVVQGYNEPNHEAVPVQTVSVQRPMTGGAPVSPTDTTGATSGGVAPTTDGTAQPSGSHDPTGDTNAPVCVEKKPICITNDPSQGSTKQ